MSKDAEREYVQRWTDTGRRLEELRWAELRALDEEAARRATRDLLDLALRVPLSRSRREWSGLVDLQDLLHGRPRRQAAG